MFFVFVIYFNSPGFAKKILDWKWLPVVSVITGLVVWITLSTKCLHILCSNSGQLSCLFVWLPELEWLEHSSQQHTVVCHKSALPLSYTAFKTVNQIETAEKWFICVCFVLLNCCEEYKHQKQWPLSLNTPYFFCLFVSITVTLQMFSYLHFF